jgi:cytochrome bd-type quinol oxidase subunit 2
VLFIFYVVACIGNAIITIVTFFLYVKARLAELEKQEKKYQSLHFITLTLFVLFGVLILIHLSNRLNGVIQR